MVQAGFDEEMNGSVKSEFPCLEKYSGMTMDTIKPKCWFHLIIKTQSEYKCYRHADVKCKGKRQPVKDDNLG